ncbi:4-hydroxy-tetrahydrodipicolinate synthase [Asanoa ferruginea]|uniref:4-hydroxy-tetrahydrodipicolinate synthase n=1 Tax=Asanoa ferruginea TaxID=53367 RepID=A0A3D9ZTG5_9ACTN|nr:dihydrodipicolinate synthase family protein [Asanoa ferruginea]REF99904.1 4-hydroxy-tetrahydrodipicolinate synthase [Asanoa ferruginea]GIF51635.1 dihydrodipicolinate synthase family protein [Asanoa ferruginea]
MTDLTGTWYISPTPFTDDGAVDTDSLRRIVDAAASWGADGITILGVMGEVADLTAAERETVLSTIAAAANNTIPFAVGCSAPAAAVVRANVARAVEQGASAVMVAAPALLKDTDQIAGFYRAAVGDSPVPVIVQDEPAATGVTLPVSALLAALDAAGSTVVKLEDPPTPPKIGRLLAQRPELTVFGGLGGVSAYSELRRGAAGTMTGFAYPEILKAIRVAFAAGDLARAAALNDRFLPYLVFEGQLKVGLGIRKEVLRRRGVLTTARTRALNPLPDPATLAELDDVLARVGLTPSVEPLELA